MGKPSKKHQAEKNKTANQVLKQLEKFTEETDITLSSDSEDAVEDAKQNFTKRSEQSVDESRKTFKIVMLAAIARSVFLPNDKTIESYDDLQEAREDDNYIDYDKETLKIAKEIAQSYLPVNLHHNPYFRRAFREVISNDEMENGSSELYNQKQGKIRTALVEIIKKDFGDMNFTKKDFEFLEDADQIWPVIKYMMEGKEIAGTDKNKDFKKLLKDLKKSGENVGEKGVAFHHIVWKKAFKGKFEESAALNPANLIAINDTRSGQGDHDKIHANSSYPKGNKQADGGGKFVDMDIFIVKEMENIHLQPRIPKSKIYKSMATELKNVGKNDLQNKKEEMGKSIFTYMSR